MQPFVDFLNVLGYVSTLIVLIGAGLATYSFVRGIAPVLWRLGRGLSNRKIAIFADSQFDDLQSVLVDSGLFKRSNLVKITKTSMKKAEGFDVFLVHWGTFGSAIEDILSMKKDATALIIYARPREIPDALLEKIDEHRNVIVANMRGRLLNDILVSMITTGYQSK